MKIINEKGKLFGLINIIDLIVTLCVIIVVAAVVYKSAAPDEISASPSKSDMYVTLRVRGAMDYLNEEVTKIQPGTPLVAGKDYIEAEVVSIESIPFLTSTTTENGTIVKATDPTKSDLIIKIHAEQDKEEPVFKIGTQEVRIGRSFVFKTQTVEVGTVIETVEFDG